MASRLILSGVRSIEECLRVNPGRISKLLLPPGRLPPRFESLKQLAERENVRVETNPKIDPDEPILALMRDYQYIEFDHLLDQFRKDIEASKKPVVLALDGITDPMNLGAILRTAAFMGIRGVVLPRDRASPVTDTVYRVASGGLEYLQIAQVTNLVAALKELKNAGFWSVGLSEHSEQKHEALTLDFPCVLVIGNEEKGIRQLVRENCDYLVRLSGGGALQSLNASVAAALAMDWARRSLLFY